MRSLFPWMRAVAGAAGVCGLLAPLQGCSGGAEQGQEPRLVVLYATCTLNRDFLSPYAEGVEYTPHLARFAAEGTTFARHVTEAGQSGVDFATLFSGRQAPEHGIYYHPQSIRHRVPLITEIFGAAGWDTHFWSGHPMASARLKYGQGVPFENVHEHSLDFEVDASGLDPEQKRRLTATDADFDALLAKLAAEPDYRAFVQVNFTLTHNPYTHYASRAEIDAFREEYPEASLGVTDEDLERYLPLYEKNRHALQYDFPARSAELELLPEEVEALARTIELVYSVCVRGLDEAFGTFQAKLEEHGLEDESIVAFTADHGELLYRDNALFPWSHGMQLAPEVLHVPWIVRAGSGTGLVAGARYESVTRSIDVLPTLAALADVPLPTGARCEGIDLSPALRGEAEPPELLAYSHTALFPEYRLEQVRSQGLGQWLTYHGRCDPDLLWVRILSGDRSHKLRSLDGETWGFEVFDLATDPEERDDLYDPENPGHAAMVEELRAYKLRLIEAFPPPAGSAGAGGELSEAESMERLRALGYVR